MLKDIDSHRASLSDITSLEGRIVVRIDGEDVCGEFSDPVVRLADQWLRKLPVDYRGRHRNRGIAQQSSTVSLSFRRPKVWR